MNRLAVSVYRFLSVGLLLAPCSVFADELKIDGTSKETFSHSLSVIAQSLTPEEREDYKRGLMNLVLTNYPPAAKAQGAELVSQITPALQAARVTLNGMTKAEIVERGRELLKNPLPRAK